MNLLHLDSSIQGINSVSRSLSEAVVRRLTAPDVALKVTYRDLTADPVPHLSGAYLSAMSGAGTTPIAALRHDVALGSTVLEEFLAANIVVIGVAMYNFTIPSQLKSWIDHILVAGKTFRYTEKGPEGLAGEKRLILALSRGGIYGVGTPMQSFEHAETYLRSAFGFVGIVRPEFVIAQGVAFGPEQREIALKGALAEIERLPLAA